MLTKSLPALNPYRPRSFVCRNGRMTLAKVQAYADVWPKYGLAVTQGLVNFTQVFGNNAPCYLEIGFGTGQSLLALAKDKPHKNFIGVETHKPGIGALLMGIKEHQLTNIRIFYGDVIPILKECIHEDSLAGVQIFFPDPWPKRRHHPRRLIQPEFIHTLTQKLMRQGTIHLATDWEDYALHMQRVMSQAKDLTNSATHDFALRSPYRPIVTKFERRALREGRAIWELQYAKNNY